MGNDFHKLKQQNLLQQTEEGRKSAKFTDGTSSNRDPQGGSSSGRHDGQSSNLASDVSPLSLSSSIDLNIDYAEEAKMIAI